MSSAAAQEPHHCTVETAPPISISDLMPKSFSKEVQAELNTPLPPDDVEIKPDGVLYLPEIKYRRIMNKVFGQGAWCLIPRGPVLLKDGTLYREYAMYCHGKYVSQAVGEQAVRDGMSEATAIEASKSSALVRCCKDLGIASELWDINYITKWKNEHAVRVQCKHATNNQTRYLWRKKTGIPFPFPWTETGLTMGNSSPSNTVPLSAVAQKVASANSSTTTQTNTVPKKTVYKAPTKTTNKYEPNLPDIDE